MKTITQALSIKICYGVIFVMLFQVYAFSQGAHNQPDWSSFEFLFGSWEGGGSGNPGEGKGSFTFDKDLDGKILLRKNLSEYPATKTHVAFTHKDLLIIYPGNTDTSYAIYFDNEGHSIHYSVFAETDKQVILLSEVSMSSPRFRLTYQKISTDSLSIRFDIAPPGKPMNFNSYLTGIVHRVKEQAGKEE